MGEKELVKPHLNKQARCRGAHYNPSYSEGLLSQASPRQKAGDSI
jgi:hypothetical protein